MGIPYTPPVTPHAPTPAPAQPGAAANAWNMAKTAGAYAQQAGGQAMAGQGVGAISTVVSGLGRVAAAAGPVGIALAALAGAAVAAGAAVYAYADKQADQLAGYSGVLSAAQANAEVSQVLNDIRRAEIMGNDLAEFVNAKSELSQNWQDLMMTMLKPFIPLVTEVMQELSAFIKAFPEFGQKVNEKAKEGWGFAFAPAIGILGLILGNTVKIEKNTKKEDKPEEDLGDFSKLLKSLEGNPMGAGRMQADAGNAGIPAFRGRGF